MTFNDHEGSSKSYTWVQEYSEVINDISFVQEQEEILVNYQEGETIAVKLHDGGYVRLTKLDKSHDPRDREAAILMLERNQEPDKIVTGLIYINENKKTSTEILDLPETPLVHLAQSDLRPSRDALVDALNSFRM